MNRFAVVLSVLCGVIGTSTTPGVADVNARLASSSCAWKAVVSHGELSAYAVAGVSNRLAWAVGQGSGGTNGTSYAATARWNGSTWKNDSPPHKGRWSEPRAAARVPGTRDLLSVGFWGDANAGVHGLVARESGSRWTEGSAPQPTGNVSDPQLWGLTVRTAGDAWAVGWYTDNDTGVNGALIERYNGSTWRVVDAVQSSDTTTELDDVVAFSGSDAWAVGFQQGVTAPHDSLLLEHWDGSSWTAVDAPAPAAGSDVHPTAISGTSSHDVWLVGYTTDSSNESRSFIEHWNGTAWKLVPNPHAQSQDFLTGVVARSTSNAVAVGWSRNDQMNQDRGLIEKWNGSKWTTQRVPAGVRSLSAVDLTPRSSLMWAVGDGDYGTTILRYC